MGVSWGGAPGWNGFGPSALLSALTFLPKSQRPAVIPARRPARTFPQGPTVRLHTRPSSSADIFPRANGPPSYLPGATPRENAV